MYTFKETAYGTVEVYKDGVRIATTTPQYAATQYGYGNAPPPVTAWDQIQTAGGTSIGTTNQQPQAIPPSATTQVSTFGTAAAGNEDPRMVADRNLQAYLSSLGYPINKDANGFTTPPPELYVPWNTDGTIQVGGLGNDPGNTGQPAYNSYIAANPQLLTTQQTNTEQAPTQTTATQVAGLPSEFQELYSTLEDFLADLEKRGQVLNPNIEITPEKLAEFTAQASREISPYFANLLKTNVDEFTRSVGFGAEGLAQNEAELGRRYGTQVRQLGEQAAEQGFAQSGLRQRDERDLALNTQNTINSARRDFAFNAGTAARQLAGEFGASSVPSINLGAAPTVSAGEMSFGRSGGDSPLYNLSDSVYQGLKGTQQYSQEVAERTRASELEQAFRNNQSLEQLRYLTI